MWLGGLMLAYSLLMIIWMFRLSHGDHTPPARYPHAVPELDQLESWLLDRISTWQDAAKYTPLNRPLQVQYESNVATLELVLAQLRAIRDAGKRDGAK
jgi:hypothetical protein